MVHSARKLSAWDIRTGQMGTQRKQQIGKEYLPHELIGVEGNGEEGGSQQSQ